MLNVLNKWNNQHQQKKNITHKKQQHKKALQIIYGYYGMFRDEIYWIEK